MRCGTRGGPCPWPWSRRWGWCRVWRCCLGRGGLRKVEGADAGGHGACRGPAVAPGVFLLGGELGARAVVGTGKEEERVVAEAVLTAGDVREKADAALERAAGGGEDGGIIRCGQAHDADEAGGPPRVRGAPEIRKEPCVVRRVALGAGEAGVPAVG